MVASSIFRSTFLNDRRLNIRRKDNSKNILARTTPSSLLKSESIIMLQENISMAYVFNRVSPFLRIMKSSNNIEKINKPTTPNAISISLELTPESGLEK